MSEGYFEREAHALISSGFVPKRMSLPVRLARRILWPLIRPFHLFTLRVIGDVRVELDAQRATTDQHVNMLRAEIAQMHSAYAHLALQLTEHENRQAASNRESGGAIYGLQLLADQAFEDIRLVRGDLFGALNNRIDHVQHLCDHLAHEMPKFVQPIVDFRSEAAAILNRFRIYGADLDAIKARCEDLEAAIADRAGALEIALSNSLATLDSSLTERLTALSHDLDGRSRQLDGQMAEQTHALGDSINKATGELRGLIEATQLEVLQLSVREEDLRQMAFAEIQATARGAAKLSSDIEALRQHVEAPHIVVEGAQNGVLLLNSSDLITKIVHQTGEWDSHVVQVMRQVARDRSGVAVDVGAHCGLHTIAMARAFDQVIAFEPNDVSYRLLQANVVLNRLDNVVLHNRPLFSREMNLALGRPELQETPIPRRGDDLDMAAAPNPGSLFFLPAEGNPDMPFPHVSLTLDNLNLPALDFLKIDVQGADGEVIMGGRSTIERFKPVIVFEWEDKLSENFSVPLASVKDFLFSAGYKVSILKLHNEKQCDYIAMPLGV